MRLAGDRCRKPALNPFSLCNLVGHKWERSILANTKKCRRCGKIKRNVIFSKQNRQTEENQ